MAHSTKTQFPKPPFRTVQDSEKGKNAHKFFDFWRTLPAEMAPFAMAKWYRVWPKIDLKLVNPDVPNNTIEITQGVCPFGEGQYESWILNHTLLGSGEYMVILNEVGVPGEIMRAYVNVMDMEQHPPKLDLRTLVRGLHQNEYYEKWLRTQNIKVPWDDPEEGDDMTTGDALKAVTEAHLNTSERLIEATEKVAEARIEALTAEADKDKGSDETVGMSAATRSIGLVADTAGKMIEMVTRHAGEQYNPVDMLKACSEVMRPTGDASQGEQWFKMTSLLLETSREANERMAKLHQDQNQLLERLLVKPDTAAAVGPTKSFLEQANEYRQIAELFGWKGGGREREARQQPEEPPEPREPKRSFGEILAENLPSIMTAASTMMVMWANIEFNKAVAKKGEGAPLSPQEALQKAAAAAPGAPVPNPSDPLQQWRLFMEQIEGPFIAHFFDPSLSGFTLAHFIQTDGTGGTAVTQNGRRVYLTVREQLGPQGFDQLVRSSPNVWPKVQGLPDKYRQFLSDFFQYDEWMAEQQKAAPAAAA